MNIENEMGVIVFFSQHCQSAGFEIERIGAEFPDATIRDISSGILYRVEFEFNAKSFSYHGHDPRKCDAIICWTNDWDSCPMTIIEMSKSNWAEVRIEPLNEKDAEILHLRIENSRLRRSFAKLQGKYNTIKDFVPRSTLSEIPDYETYKKICNGRNGEGAISVTELMDKYKVPKSTAYRWFSQYGQDIAVKETVITGG